MGSLKSRGEKGESVVLDTDITMFNFQLFLGNGAYFKMPLPLVAGSPRLDAGFLAYFTARGRAHIPGRCF